MFEFPVGITFGQPFQLLTPNELFLQRTTFIQDDRNYIHEYQSGFKRLHSTIDCLVRLESAIQETFLRDEYMIAVFLDIEKAYDMLWKYSISEVISNLGLVGHLAKFIINFLSDRSIRVRIGDKLSESYPIENGIPQGSVLSCQLFSMIS